MANTTRRLTDLEAEHASLNEHHAAIKIALDDMPEPVAREAAAALKFTGRDTIDRARDDSWGIGIA